MTLLGAPRRVEWSVRSPFKVTLRCQCGAVLAIVPPELLDKGVEVNCHKCHKWTTFD